MCAVLARRVRTTWCSTWKQLLLAQVHLQWLLYHFGRLGLWGGWSRILVSIRPHQWAITVSILPGWGFWMCHRGPIKKSRLSWKWRWHHEEYREAEAAHRKWCKRQSKAERGEIFTLENSLQLIPIYKNLCLQNKKMVWVWVGFASQRDSWEDEIPFHNIWVVINIWVFCYCYCFLRQGLTL
jgi:hypothetical protein